MFDYFYNNYHDDHPNACNTEASVWLSWYCEKKYDPLWAKRILEPQKSKDDICDNENHKPR